MSKIDNLRSRLACVQARMQPLLDESVRLSKAIEAAIVERQGGGTCNGITKMPSW